MRALKREPETRDALVEAMALGLQAVQMLRTNADIGEQFCDARLGDSMARNFGTLNATAAFRPLIDRALITL